MNENSHSELNLSGCFIFVAAIDLHSDQIWRDLGAFYNLVEVLEKFLKIKKAGN